MKSESIGKMASIDESSEAAVLDQNDAVKIAASCLNDPNYAIICVFLQKFGSQLKIEHPDFLRLQKMIEDTDEVHEELKQFFVRLLRKTRKSVQPDKLDSALVKFCYTYSMHDAWEVERFGYRNASIAVKLRVMKEILESQFDKNPNFRTIVGALSGMELRSQPLGKDKLGNAYWCTVDKQCNLRIYQEHLDEEIWKVVATNREEMVKLIACLRGNELVMPSLLTVIDEDSSSNSMPPKIDALQENGDDAQSNGVENASEKPNVPNLKIKLNTNGNTNEVSAQIANGNKSNGADEEDEEEVEEDGEEEEEEEEEDEDDDDDEDASAMSEVDEMSAAASESSTTTAGTKSTETQGSKRFSLLASKPPSNKLKLRVSNDSKNATGKRRFEIESDAPPNKSRRPTLMSSKSKKPTVESDEEESDDDGTDEEESDEEEGEEEEEEEDDDEDELSEEAEVGSAIEEPTMYVHGEGSGKANKCENTMQWPDIDKEQDEDDIGEAIEEETMYVYGEGSGHDCDGGNEDTKTTESNATNATETKPIESKPMFFFGQAGCLKLSPMMKPTTTNDVEKSHADADYETTHKSETTSNNESSTSTNPDASSELSLPDTSNNHAADETDKALNTSATETATLNESQIIPDVKSEASKTQSLVDSDGKTSDGDNNLSSDVSMNNATSSEECDVTNANAIDTPSAEMNSGDTVNNESEPLNATESKSEILSEKIESNCSEALENESVQECGAFTAVTFIASSSTAESVISEKQPESSDGSEEENDGLIIDENKANTAEVSDSETTDIIDSEARDESSVDLNEAASGGSCEPIKEIQSDPKDDDENSEANGANLTIDTGANVPTETQIHTESEVGVPSAPESQSDDIESEDPPITNISKGIIGNEDASRSYEIRDSKQIDESEVKESHSPIEASIQQAVEERIIEEEPIELSTTKQDIEPAPPAIICSEKVEQPRKQGANLEEHVESGPSKDATLNSDETVSSKSSNENTTIVTGIDLKAVGVSSLTTAPIDTEPINSETTSTTNISDISASTSKQLAVAKEKDLTPAQNELIAKVESLILPDASQSHKAETTIVENQTILAKSASEKRKSADNIEEPFVCKKVYICGDDSAKTSLDLAGTNENIEKLAEETPEVVKQHSSNSIMEADPKTESPQTTELAPKAEVIEDKSSISVNKTEIDKHQNKSVSIEIKTERISHRVSKSSAPSTTITRTSNRKRRISEPKARLSSESENDNFEPLADSPLSQDASNDEEVGGKRIKMRPRTVQKAVRQTAEQKRNIKDTEWSSDENITPSAKRTTRASEKTIAAEATVTEKATTPVKQTEVKVSQNEISHVKADTGKEVDDEEAKDGEPSDEESVKGTKKAGRPARRGRRPGPKPKARPSVERIVEEPKQAEPEPEPQEKPAPKEAKPDTRRKKRSLMGLDIAEVEIFQSNIDNEPPVRQSRRIAQIKIREEADRRKAEEVALLKMKQASEKKKKNQTTPPESESEEENSESEAKLEKKKRRKKGNKDRPWQTDSDDVSERDEDDIDDHEHEHEDRLPPLGSDHEFSPESDIEDVPTKRARTARKDKTEKKEEGSEEEEDVHACQKCGKNDHPEWILLCDKCDKGYHCSCLIPVLFVIPEGSWFCPLCQQDKLIDELVSRLDDYDARVRQKEIEEAQRERILLTSISEANVLRDTKRDRQRARAANRSQSDESSDYSSTEESDVSNERKHNRGEREKRSKSNRQQRKRAESTDKNSNSDDSSDDEPIYKFRKRRQATVSYRFNEYDELINRAIKKEMDEVAGAGNLGRGKDISTIIEADKEKKRQQQMEQVKEEKAEKEDDDDESDDEPIAKQKAQQSDGSDSEPLMPRVTKRNKSAGRKKKKLNSLDSDSEEDVDQSDDDFKASISSSSDSEDEEASVDSASSMDSLYRKKKKKAGRMTTRRSGRQRKKRFDADFIDDDSFDDEDDIPLVKKMKKKVESEYSDSNDSSEEELEEDVDSEDLCDDSTDESDKPWSSSRKKPKPKPKPIGGKTPRKPIAKAKKPKKKSKSSDDDSDSNEVLPKSRRTRGKKLPYLLDEDFDSSDDGIRPGVKRPDTPPEEREAFIKKQEEIKRMLAEKMNDDQVILPQANDSLSTIPKNIIQSAKALDIDLKKSAVLHKAGSDNDSNAFDDDLPEDFDPEDMDEDAIAKMMEEEEFAQQQLKLAGETIRNKKQKDSLTETPKKEGKISLDIGSSVIMPNISPSLVSPLPFGQSLAIPDIPPSMYAVQLAVSKSATTPKKRGRKKEEPLIIPEIPKAAQNLAEQFIAKDQPLPPLSTIQHTSVLPSQSLSLKANVPLNIPSIIVPHGPPPQLFQSSAIQHTSSVIAHSSSIPPQRPTLPPMPHAPSSMLGLPGQKSILPPSLMDSANTRLMDPSELVKPPDDLFESPTKKRGRRKKITPLRESLQPAVPTPNISPSITHQIPAPLPSPSKTQTSILSERLTGSAGNKSAISTPLMPQLYSPSSRAQSSVITRLPKQQPRPFGPDQSPSQRFYPPGAPLPPHSTIAHSRSPYPNVPAPGGHRPPLGSPHANAHLPHPMYMRGQPGIYGAYPNMQPPIHRSLQSIEHVSNSPQDFPGSYQNLPFSSYYAAAAAADRRSGALISSFEPFDNKNAPPGHPALYGHPGLGPLTAIRNPASGGEGDDERNANAHPPTGDSPSEFSGLVSYFSSQQDLD